jgi:O-antigen ligase
MVMLCFSLPMPRQVSTIFIAVVMLLWVLEGNFTKRLQMLNNRYFFISISLYVLYGIGLIYTENLKSGWFEMEQKLSMLIFPLLFFTTAIDQISVKKMLRGFVLGCALAALICLIKSCYNYYLTGEKEVFLYAKLSLFMHVSYFAMYLCFAVVILLFNDQIVKGRLTKMLLLLFFGVTIILLSSKSGVISLALILVIKIIHDVVVNKQYFKATIATLLILFTASMSYILFPKTFDRFKEMKLSISGNSKELDSTTGRVHVWKHAVSLIAKHPIAGVGTGDVKDELKKRYKAQNEQLLIEKELNAHNQFLQTGIALGIPGAIFLLGLLLIVAIQTIRNELLVGSFLLLLTVINFLFESMLETQSGVVFIYFFMMLFFSIAVKKPNKNNTFAST